ncbi:tRNA-His guanylyltransferase [Thelotrema lepadinum]|nr:tRNA-His guanylyltransferase [Thelotrema lepadinum]
MANSKYEYVKAYERHMTLLPSTFIVVRIDGRGFHRLSRKYEFEKPNDSRALELMNASAVAVMNELPDVSMAYGVSDEYRFEADCHINNLYNTAFWSLVLKGELTEIQAEENLRGTVSSDKNEILFSKFGINYNNEPERFKKGTIVYRNYENEHGNESQPLDTTSSKDHKVTSKTQREKERKRKQKAQITVDNVDIIKDTFWDGKPWLLL